MFHVVLVSFLTLCVVQAAPIKLGGSSEIDISSSKHKNEIQLVIAVNGSLGEQMVLSTEALSPEHGSHTLKLGVGKIDFIPRLKQSIIFNYEHEGQYLVGLSHSLKSQILHFLPLEISWNGNRRQMFLPALDMKMQQIDKNSLYRCHNTLISIEVEEKTQRVTLIMFTKDKKDSIWYLGGNWQHNWRHYHQKIYFGGAFRDNLSQNIRISLTNNKYCEFNLNKLQKSEGHLDNKKYYTIDDILGWVKPFQLKEQVQVADEEL